MWCLWLPTLVSEWEGSRLTELYSHQEPVEDGGEGVTKAIQSVESFYQWALCVLPQQHPNRHCQLNWPLSMKENNRDSLQRLQKTVDWLATGWVANQNSELHIVKHSNGKCETRYKKWFRKSIWSCFVFQELQLMSQHICLIYRVDNIEKTDVLYGLIIVEDSLAKSDPESF